MQRMSDNGGSNILVLHDIMPLSCPVLFPTDFYPRTAKNHASWFDNIVVNSDAVVAISKSVAEDFLGYVACEEKADQFQSAIGLEPFGRGFRNRSRPKRFPRKQHRSAPGQPHFFLSVRSLEPRKGVRIAIEAMDLLWEEGIDVGYLIAGACRYCARALVARIFSHPEYGRRLFWLDDVSNADLCHL